MHTCSHLIHTVQFVCVHCSKSNTHKHSRTDTHTHARTHLVTHNMSVHLAVPVFFFYSTGVRRQFRVLSVHRVAGLSSFCLGLLRRNQQWGQLQHCPPPPPSHAQVRSLAGAHFCRPPWPHPWGRRNSCR